MTEQQNTTPPSTRNIIIASCIAFAVAMVVLFTAILPAEFGRDPLGTGELLGLNVLSAEENPFEEHAEIHRTDYVEFILEPFQSVEYKYLMDLDAPMIFSWVADGEVYYDMHAEPAGLGEEYAESFEQGNADRRMGSFHAPFAGIHGWFWENRSLNTIVVEVYSSGYYQTSTVFRDGGDYERVIEPVAE
ncbi:MAG: hypothetical protein HOF74_04375 [Gammaproteobacteria bacterium]|nr:hypothetical protein [Gammaproteobacteria bacterium]MBT3859044.1 hypothetical protein [Gammaproteobacteria bacterium]MBT3987845.1 hypothetical protein [Gammaproteobacteria bacterium]MBT4254446.1 hypothetical protein [Gammaproteobacteria bacterium]MBT4659861.1 hypothetical protein [Gammaproteobacteria bacterium]